jgi:hypothetical protein
VAEVAGAEILRDAHGRRVAERDRWGGDVAHLTWTPDGALGEAAVRLPDGSWLFIHPRALHDARWGASDIVRLDDSDSPLTHFAAVNWACIDAIPPLAEPARLPPGGGTAVLNLIAALASDQGRTRLRYQGPYPTEQLFVALLEAFRWESDETLDDPLSIFMAGGLTWTPAPFRRAFTPQGAYVQSRERIEKVVWRGRTYLQADWQGVIRHGPHRVHDAGAHVQCSLWALGTVLQWHLVLTPAGDVVAVHEPVAAGSATSMSDDVAAGLVAIVIASSAPPLAEAIRAEAADLTFAWAPLAGELAVVTHGHAHLSHALLAALHARLATVPGRVEQVRLGFAALAELAAALGDAVRARAQVRLAAGPPSAQAHALSVTPSAEDAAANARQIGRAVEALLESAGQLTA